MSFDQFLAVSGIILTIFLWIFTPPKVKEYSQSITFFIGQKLLVYLVGDKIYAASFVLFFACNFIGFWFYGWRLPAIQFGSPISSPPLLLNDACSTIYFISAAVLLVGTVYRLIRRVVRPNEKIQVIAWEGWENDGLYHPNLTHNRRLTKRYLDFLLYLRGLGTVPVLYTSDKRPYDVLIADAEFLKIYGNEGRLYSIETFDQLNERWDHVTKFIRNDMQHFVRIGNQRRAIPCRWGFQEILVNQNLFQQKQHQCEYASLRIETLLKENENLHVGIWNWFLPTISVILATNGIPLSDAHSQSGNKVKDCLAPIMNPQWRHRIHLINKIDEISRKMRSDHVDIVYGAGSWALPYSEKSVVCLVPDAGVFTWTECAAILNDRVGSDSRASALIHHWLCDDTQKLLRYGPPSRALPAIGDILKDTYDNDEKHPASKTLRALLDEHLEPRDRHKIVPRHLPPGPIQIEWEHQWALFRDWLLSASAPS
jgi:hypothetical protein